MTTEGRNLLLKTFEVYNPDTYSVYKGALPIKDLYGKFPEFSEIASILRHIYGPEFMTIYEQSLEKIEEEFDEENNNLTTKTFAEFETVSNQ